jgi:uncharacterized protein YxjI
MRYLVKQKLLAFTDRFMIQNELGEDVYSVVGQFFSFGKKLTLMDTQEQEVCFIEQKLLAFMPEYNLSIHGQHVANIRKRFTLFSNNFDIECIFGAYEVQGDMFGYEFGIYKDGIQVASISKQFFTFRDTYGIDVADDQDPVLTIAMAIVIDMIFHENKN